MLEGGTRRLYQQPALLVLSARPIEPRIQILPACADYSLHSPHTESTARFHLVEAMDRSCWDAAIDPAASGILGLLNTPKQSFRNRPERSRYERLCDHPSADLCCIYDRVLHGWQV